MLEDEPLEIVCRYMIEVLGSNKTMTVINLVVSLNLSQTLSLSLRFSKKCGKCNNVPGASHGI
jgi:hypothetical protein